MKIGAVADDLTGATDLALTLSRAGMRTIQVIGVPAEGFDFGDADAAVIALKSRTIRAKDAVEQSVAAMKALAKAGATQFIFKYCSTFDSTPAGNIGPVTEALMELTGERLTIACPAFPANGRFVYRGHLFVGNSLLSDSSMKDHPLTPMTDSNLVRVLQRQTSLKVGLVDHDVVRQGAADIRKAFDKAVAEGIRIVIVDAIDEGDLRAIGHAAASLKLVTGGSAIAIGLPENFGATPQSGGQHGIRFALPPGRGAILAGSCSAKTRRQVADAIDAGFPALKIDPLAIAKGDATATSVTDWIVSQNPRAIPLVYSSAEPTEVRQAQDRLGQEEAGAAVEHLLAQVAVILADSGFNRFIMAGGETSGAVVTGLGVSALEIGDEIDPGVPWTRTLAPGPAMALALKSGNFGTDDFFLKAWKMIE